MGIISIKDKRTSSNNTKTTGKEVSYFSSHKFAEADGVQPKITGHYHYFGIGTGGFGAFWEETDGSVSSLTFSSTQTSIWSSTERSASVQTAITTYWYDFEIDLSGKSNGRPVFYVRRGDGTSSNNYQNDWALDDIIITTSGGVAVSFDPSYLSIRSGGHWMKTDVLDDIESYTDAMDNYSSATLSTIPNESGSSNFVWNYKTGSTGSSGTGPDNAADNNDTTYYLYWEATGSGNHKCSYLTLKDYRNMVTGAAL